jgi:hypothetical protein
MIVPHGNPRKLLVASKKIEIGTVSGKALAIVVECRDLLVRKRDAADGLTPAVVTVLVLVDVVA